jgi:hypothetical protein
MTHFSGGAVRSRHAGSTGSVRPVGSAACDGAIDAVPQASEKASDAMIFMPV